MDSEPICVLVVGDARSALVVPPGDDLKVRSCASLVEASTLLSAHRFDALLVLLHGAAAASEFAAWQPLSQVVLDVGVVIAVDQFDLELAERLIERGAQDVLPAASLDAGALRRVLRLAVVRKRLERSARTAYATDLSTGLPHRAQLLEHMTHLLALREREPAPMALLVLRIEGLATTERTLGSEAANVLRRKLAVRLRAGLRASDVVASVGHDAFGVLLAWIDAPDDAMRVAGKLALALQQPLRVAGQDQAVAVAVGVSQYPEHGRLADELLRRAVGQATGAAPIGRAGFANRVERGGTDAANDE